MTLTSQMIATSPARTGYDPALLARSIQACFECAQVCTACADACLCEDTVAELRQCITLDLTARTCAAQPGAHSHDRPPTDPMSPDLC